jgi:hypothetical protein
MKINEIELVNIGQSFPINKVTEFLARSSPNGMLENFVVNYVESGNHRGIILTDRENNIAAYAGFVVKLNGRVWQAKNAVSYDPYRGQALVGKIYKMVKQELKQSIQSDTEQTRDGMNLWTKTLPSLGLRPMGYDTQTGHVLDPEQTNNLMYPQQGAADEHRYSWILERNDHYPEQNLLKEGSLLMPYQGLWYNFKEEKK